MGKVFYAVRFGMSNPGGGPPLCMTEYGLRANETSFARASSFEGRYKWSVGGGVLFAEEEVGPASFRHKTEGMMDLVSECK